ncbi:hypothetical protein EV702DRAFT_1269678 [Suillus placidus]|uniref:Uncharacterized protein n=1 Tax=Suillus placidus TaxID=48579 RepID=A0A9P6ZQQ2_9AGAM|nr:hypothetical protein EV702DRAFT_1269678 [Suillus placidus]
MRNYGEALWHMLAHRQTTILVAIDSLCILEQLVELVKLPYCRRISAKKKRAKVERGRRRHLTGSGGWVSNNARVAGNERKDEEVTFYHLTSNGDWRGPTAAAKVAAKHIYDARVSCMTELPGNAPFAFDNNVTVKNLKWLQDKAAEGNDFRREGFPVEDRTLLCELEGRATIQAPVTLSFRELEQEDMSDALVLVGRKRWRTSGKWKL